MRIIALRILVVCVFLAEFPLFEGAGGVGVRVGVGVRSGESESGESLGALVFFPAISEPQGSVDSSLQSPSLRGSGESESESGESEFWESPRSGLEQTVFPFSAVPLSEGVGGVGVFGVLFCPAKVQLFSEIGKS